jgi:hypothetical protein
MSPPFNAAFLTLGYIYPEVVCAPKGYICSNAGLNVLTNFFYTTLFMTITSTQYSDWLRAGRPRGRGSSPGRGKNFLFSTLSRPALGSTQLPIHWVPGALSSGVKRPGREADHSSPASAEVKKMWIYISTSLYIFME